MPLSEHEQRLLDQIERALYQEDPKFASSVRANDLRTHMRKRMRRAAVVLVGGLGLLLAGVITAKWWIGVAGFGVMVVALILALSSWKRLNGGPNQAGLGIAGSNAPRRTSSRRKSGGGSSGSLSQRLEERWKRRWEERGGR